MDMLARIYALLIQSELDEIEHQAFLELYGEPVTLAVWDTAGVVGESKCESKVRKENNDWRNKGRRGFNGYNNTNHY